MLSRLPTVENLLPGLWLWEPREDFLHDAVGLVDRRRDAPLLVPLFLVAGPRPEELVENLFRALREAELLGLVAGLVILALQRLASVFLLLFLELLVPLDLLLLVADDFEELEDGVVAALLDLLLHVGELVPRFAVGGSAGAITSGSDGTVGARCPCSCISAGRWLVRISVLVASVLLVSLGIGGWLPILVRPTLIDGLDRVHRFMWECVPVRL